MDISYKISPEEMEDIKSNRVRPFKTLFNLCIQRIIVSNEHFIALDHNPFSDLPFTVVQQVFENLFKLCIPMPEDIRRAFVLNLLNPSIKHCNFIYIFTQCIFRNYPELLYTHTLENCPNIEKFEADLGIYEGKCTEELLAKMSTKWKKLRILNLTHLSVFTNETILLIRTHLPQLEHLVLETNDVKHWHLTSECLEHLSNMKALKILSFKTENRVDFGEAIWAHVVGSIPSLKDLSLSFESKEECRGLHAFIANYSQFYHNKSITLDKFRVNYQFSHDWPKNVALDKLEVYGPFENLHYVHLIPPVKKLSFLNCPPRNIYQVVEKRGAEVSELSVWLRKSIRREALSVERVVAACPQVSEISITFDGPLDRNYELTPFNFRNCQKLELNFDGNYEKECEKLYTMLLLGTEMHFPSRDIFNVLGDYEIKVILKILKKGECQYLRKVKSCHIHCGEASSVRTHNSVFELIIRILQNSPLAQEVSVYFYIPSSEEGVDEFINKCQIFIDLLHTIRVDCRININNAGNCTCLFP